MKMGKIVNFKKTMIILFVILLSSKLYAGDFIGNGGDSCENRFIEIRKDIKYWISNGGAENLNLPEDISVETYSKLMLEKIDVNVNCITEKIVVDGYEKICRNYKLFFWSDFKIECNRDAFLKLSDEQQYRLVHHEYAGLAGFEVTTEGLSEYEISNQITNFLEDKIVKRLVVKPLEPQEIPEKVLPPIRSPLDFLQKQFAEANDPLSVEILTQAEINNCTMFRGNELASNKGHFYAVVFSEIPYQPEVMEYIMRYSPYSSIFSAIIVPEVGAKELAISEVYHAPFGYGLIRGKGTYYHPMKDKDINCEWDRSIERCKNKYHDRSNYVFVRKHLDKLMFEYVNYTDDIYGENPYNNAYTPVSTNTKAYEGLRPYASGYVFCTVN